uniref:Homeodomain-interacting protein kinase 4-like n=1 Tax=Callorhinchus milii TaxID=7868 RepID=A0A4W3KI90_CALMI
MEWPAVLKCLHFSKPPCVRFSGPNLGFLRIEYLPHEGKDPGSIPRQGETLAKFPYSSIGGSLSGRGLTIQSDSDTYDTLKLVGEGIYGEVTKCRKRSTGRFVALKALKHICCGSTEIRILKLLGKTDADEFHIVRLLEYFHVNARPHLVFELLDQSLLDFHKATDFAPLPVKHIRVIATQLLKALVKLKELSIIHTDLKPDNIMLVNHVQFPFRVKLIDFGSASVLTEVQHIQEPYIQARYYRSPEILLGLPFCEKMDMWSLGCVLSELRLGRPLYPGRNQYEQIMYIVQTQGLPKDYLHWRPFTAHQWELKSPREYPSHASVPPLETGRPTLNNMVQLLKRMLSLDPKTRIAPTAALRHQCTVLHTDVCVLFSQRETNEATCSKGQATLQPDGASQEHTSPKRSELPTRRRGSRKPSTTKPEVAASRSKPAPVDSFSVAPKPPESKMAIFVHRHGEPGLQLAKQQVLVCAGQCKSPHRELTSMIGDHNKHFFVGSQPGI